MVIPDHADYNENLRQTGHWASMIPFHHVTQTASLEETQELSEQLFHNIVSERVRHDYMTEQGFAPNTSPETSVSRDETDSSISDFINGLCYPIEYKKPSWKQIGAELGQMADKFAQSSERQEVRKQAESVSYQELTKKDNFFDLLTGLFSSGPARNTMERIVVLFVFCSDLLIRALKDKVIGKAKQFLSWSVSFFRDKVSYWVQKQGGWSALVNDHFPRFAVYTCLAAVTIAAVIYIKRNWV